MSQLVEEVARSIAEALDNDQLDLPTLPEVALDIREAADDENTDATRLAGVIGKDAGLAAKLIKVANSPLYRAAKPIENLQMAINRLGIDQATNLTTSLAMQQMFQATSDLVDRKIRGVWAHATDVAAIASSIAKHFTRLKPDKASLAGLVHSIGVLPILGWAEENDFAITDSITLDQVIEALHGDIGYRILTAWDFPEEINSVPVEYGNYYRPGAKPDYIDVVMVAVLKTRIGSSHPSTMLDWSQIAAFDRLGVDPEFECLDTDEIREELDGIRTVYA